MSCTAKTDVSSLEMPSFPIVSREMRVALVVDPYIALRDKPGDEGITIEHARRGEVFIVQGKKILESAGRHVLWINLGAGWVMEDSVQLYSSEARARAAGSELKQELPEDQDSSGMTW